MKNLLTLALIASFLLACNSAPENNTINIKDYRTEEQPKVNVDEHKKGDVEVHRISFMENSYEIIYFHDYSGELHDYHGTYSAPDDFDSALFNWDNDTSITINLLMSGTDKRFTMHLFGNGAISGLRIDD